jgi:putative peptidoglycan lipid II flippase
LISEPLTRLLFERGAFTATDTLVTSRVQTLFFLQIPFHVAGMVLVRLLSALGRNFLLMLFGVIMVGTNTVADIILMQFLGVAGIALSTSLVFVVSFLLLYFGAKRAVPTIKVRSA